MPATQFFPSPNPKGTTLDGVTIDATTRDYTNNGNIINSTIKVGIDAYNPTLHALTNNGKIDNTSINFEGSLRNSGTISNSKLIADERMGEIINLESGFIDGSSSLEYNGMNSVFSNRGQITNLQVLVSNVSSPNIPKPKNESTGIILGSEWSMEAYSVFQNDGTFGDFDNGEVTIIVGEQVPDSSAWFINHGTMNFRFNANWRCIAGKIDNYGSIYLGNPEETQSERSFAALEIGHETGYTSTLNNYKSGSIVNSNYTVEIHLGSTITNNGSFLNNKQGELAINGTFDNSQNPQAEKGLINYGTVLGKGNIKGSWIDHGVLQPGNSSGGMLVDGNYYKEDGIKEIELGGDDDKNRCRLHTEHDFIDVTGDLIINGGSLDVSLINDFKLQIGQEFIISKVDGEVTGTYSGLVEGALVGKFDSIYGLGSQQDLYITYKAGDGNDIGLYTTNSSLAPSPSPDQEPVVPTPTPNPESFQTADGITQFTDADDVLTNKSDIKY
ncbi:hypothetical protein OAE71_02775, partial [Synechococcus sp. AH-551-A21]